MADDATDLKTAEDDGELLATIMERYKASREHLSAWREEARECFEFYANRQWSQEEEEILKNQMRPTITFNRSAVLIDAVLGYEVNNRQETRFIPRTLGDAKVNEELTKGSEYFRDECDAEFEESDAFRDMLICGMGWTGDRLDATRNPEYDLIRERIDPFEMMADPSARKPNLADARYMMRKKWMARDEVRQMFPEWDSEGGNADWLADDEAEGGIQHTDPRNRYKGNNDSEVGRDIPTLEYQWMTLEDRFLIKNPQNGKEIYLTKPQVDENKDALAQMAQFGVQPKQVKKSVYRRAFVIGGEIVKPQNEPSPYFAPYCDGFSYGCITGMRDRNKSTWFGMMRRLRDPQVWSNKWLAQIMHILNSGAKPGYDVEEGAIKNQADFEQKASKPGAINTFVSGAIQNGRIQYRNPPTMPTGFDKLVEYANKSFGDVSGVNQELLGMADREQAGVLEYQRKQSAVTLLAPLFDSLRRYRKITGRCWLYMMQNYIADGRMIRITMDDGEQFVPFNKSETAEYDVVIDQASSAPNQKEATWAVMTQLLPIIGDRLGPDEFKLILEYSPLPESFMEKFKEMEKAKEGQPPPPDPAMVKVQMDAQLKQQQLQFDQQKAQQDGQIEQAKTAATIQLTQAQAKAQLELEQAKAAAALQMKQAEMQQTMVLEQQKAQADFALAQAEMQNQLQIEQIKVAAQIELQNKVATAKAQTNHMVAAEGIKNKQQAKTDTSKASNDSSKAVVDAVLVGFDKIAKEMAKPKDIVRAKDGRASRIVQGA